MPNLRFGLGRTTPHFGRALEELRKLYETGEIIEDSGTEGFDESGHVMVPPWKEAEVATMLELLDRHHPNRGRLLDVGCLWGIFLTRAVAEGWEAEGFEPWSKAANYCREAEGLQVQSGTLEEVDYGLDKFDAITLFDVIEHLHNPFQQLSRLSTWLRPGGCLVVSTPNYLGLLPRLQGLARRLTGRPWAHLTPPFHLYDFTPRTLATALRRAGLQPVETLFLTVEETMMSGVVRPNWKKHLSSFIGKISVALRQGDRMVMVGQRPKCG